MQGGSDTTNKRGSPTGFRDQGNMVINFLGTRKQKENKAGNKSCVSGQFQGTGNTKIEENTFR